MEHILHLKGVLICSSSPFHCVAQTGNLWNLIWKRIFFTIWQKKQWPGLSWEWPLASKDSRLCGLTQEGGSEERSGLFFRTAFFAALSLRASTSRFLPPVLQSTSSYVKNIHGYCSFSLAMSRYPTNHATKAFWKTIRSQISQKTVTSRASALWLMCSVEI